MQPYNYQAKVARLIREGKNVILQAPTGAGKTFASLMPFLQAWTFTTSKVPHKCIYSVPMRVLANQFMHEYDKFVKEKLRRVEAIPQVKRQTGEYKEDPRFTKSQLTFATIDQVLSSWLMHPYSISGREGNINAGAFVGSYLIFDEFHLFDPDSTLPTTLHMLKTLKGISPFLLMTATFSAEMLSQLAEALDATAVLLSNDPVPKNARNIIHISPDDIPSQNKIRFYHTVQAPLVWRDEDKNWHINHDAVQNILDLHVNQSGQQRTLIVCNQVERAQRLYDALNQAKLKDVELRLLHSRFRKANRQHLEHEIQREFGKKLEERQFDSMIVVATQVVEVGLDMSAQMLHTELAPAAAILQRAGRCARREGETGQVYVYHLEPEAYAPYHGRYATEQCNRTWDWLTVHTGEHLDFQDEQALINHAHAPTDRLILDGLNATKRDHERAIFALWRGDGNRGEAQKLIRNIQAVSVVAHPHPEQLTATPFNVESFSLHPGTLKSKFLEWQAQNDAIDEYFEEGHLDWLVKRLEELDGEEDTSSNQKVQYDFKKVTSEHNLHGPLFVINPALVGYSPELGLTLDARIPYQHQAVPQNEQTPTNDRTFSSRLESYYRHIELVHEAFVADFLQPLTDSATRLENAFGWSAGIITETAHLVICLHDVGKLNKQWQQWVHNWQNKTQQAYDSDGVYAHWDAAGSEAHKALERKLKRERPHHAIEGAIAGIPLLEAVIPESCEPLFRAAFTAISRHHTTFAGQAGSYKLIPKHLTEIHRTLQMPDLPSTLFTKCLGKLAGDSVEANIPLQRELQAYCFIREENVQDMCCYMVLVRALRLADQKGTAQGSRKTV